LIAEFIIASNDEKFFHTLKWMAIVYAYFKYKIN